MSPLENNNKFFWYILILLSLFVLVLFTRTQLMDLQVNLDEKAENENSLNEERSELQRLNDIKNNLNGENSDVEKYLVDISEDELIDYIYSAIEEDNLKYTDGLVVVKNISMTEWIKNEMWFTESQITLNLRVPSEVRMYRILDFFSGEDSKYKFFIDTFSYPNKEWETSFNISLPLKVFYK